VLTAQKTIIILTPNSIKKPWPMYECGAVMGRVLEKNRVTEDSLDIKSYLIPIRFNLDNDDIPAPLRRLNSINGRDQSDIRTWLSRLLNEFFPDTEEYRTKGLYGVLDEQIPKLMADLDKALENTPQLITDEVVQEWLRRLDDLEANDRMSEVEHMHNWIRIMFDGPSGLGRSGDRLWDIRLHMRLGEIYHKSKQYEKAIEQYEIVKSITPLDFFILSRLTLACLDNHNLSKAEENIRRINDLVPNAEETSAEIAGLIGRYWKEAAKDYSEKQQKQKSEEAYRKARKAYIAGLNRNSNSYYMADNIGQLSLKLNEIERAKEAYQQAETILNDLKEDNIWTLATKTTVAIVLGRENDALTHLKQIGSLGASKRDIKSVRKGLEDIAEQLEIPYDKVFIWISAMEPKSA
jgi:tetratricopeptide (TPR) repeat protein